MQAARSWIGYASAVAGASLCTLAGLAMTPRFDIVNVAMVYLVAVVVVALRFTRGAAIACALLCVLAFDIVFVPPQGVLTVNDVQYLLTFAIMLIVALVISHLTERRQDEAAARAKLELEAGTERVRSTLLASISHDLRTPLAVLTGASSTLAERGERLAPAEREALARSLFAQARDLSEQVDKVLQMTRLETRAPELDRDWASIAEIAASLLDRFADRLASHRVLVEIPPDLPLVRIDAVLIEQALGNLLDNAARHTRPGTVVRLRAWRHEGQVVVSVEDSGLGLGALDRQRLFAKFERGSAEAGGRGMGLGLAICRAVVALHGGRTWAEPTPGGGLTFRFSLPLEAEPPLPGEAEIA